MFLKEFNLKRRRIDRGEYKIRGKSNKLDTKVYSKKQRKYGHLFIYSEVIRLD